MVYERTEGAASAPLPGGYRPRAVQASLRDARFRALVFQLVALGAVSYNFV